MKKSLLPTLVPILLALSGLLFAFSSITFAQSDEDMKFLSMYYKEEDLFVESPTRGKKSLTRVAENITVVSAEEIKLMNAHTVADVLNTVTGVQVIMTGGPGSLALAYIQGSENRHVAVFMDGIPLNNLGDNVADLGSLPVQHIEKIEIIKGPASSAWGSALGGVINIITKSGSEDEQNRMASASYGMKNTGDIRLETAGKQRRLGYYVTAGRLQTDGFRPHNDFSSNNAYTKLTYDLTKNSSLLFTLGYDRLSRGVVEIRNQDLFIANESETVTTTFFVNSSLDKDTELNLSFWRLRRSFDLYNNQLSTGAEISNPSYVDDRFGTSIKLTWKNEQQNIVVGADYDASQLESNSIAGNEQSIKRQAYFINDTISIHRLSVTPGIRYDKTDTSGDFTSPSLGMTYKIGETSLLRAYAARGFNIPSLYSIYGDDIFYSPNPGLEMETVWSYQLGAETTALRYFWLKLSAFKHDIRNIIEEEMQSETTFTRVNRGKARRQGMEMEIKTMPVFHTSFSAGAAFMNARDLEAGRTVPNIPQRTYDIGIHYDEENIFKALLTGHYIDWNSAPVLQGKYDAIIFDLHITKNLPLNDERTLEVFFDIHNIFNGSQYALSIYKNPERWFEGGVRYMF